MTTFRFTRSITLFCAFGVLAAATAAQALALALQFATDAATQLANAGYLPPRINSSEMTSEPSLRLGIDPDAEYEDTLLQFGGAPFAVPKHQSLKFGYSNGT